MKKIILSMLFTALVALAYSQVDEEFPEPKQKSDDMITLLSKSKSVGGRSEYRGPLAWASAVARDGPPSGPEC